MKQPTKAELNETILVQQKIITYLDSQCKKATDLAHQEMLQVQDDAREIKALIQVIKILQEKLYGKTKEN